MIFPFLASHRRSYGANTDFLIAIRKVNFSVLSLRFDLPALRHGDYLPRFLGTADNQPFRRPQAARDGLAATPAVMFANFSVPVLIF